MAVARLRLRTILVCLLLAVLACAAAEAKPRKPKDLYHILGVDKGASQRDIQKAFHKLSLKFHPDKNPSPDAQAKFSDISNAYDILSDEQKRKQYDLYGDDASHYGSHEDGRSPFDGSRSSQGWNDFSGNTDGGSSYQRTYGYGSQEGPKGFHFHFSGRPQAEEFTNDASFPFSFGGSDFIESMFGNLFKFGGGSRSGNQKQGGDFGSTQTAKDSRKKNFKLPDEIEQLDPSKFKHILQGSGAPSLVLFYLPESVDWHEKSKILVEVAKSLNGIVKVRAVNCQVHKKICEEQGAWPSKQSRLMIYDWKRNSKKRGLEYTGRWTAQAVTTQCVQLLPQISTLVPADEYDILSQTSSKLARALLLTKKREIPLIWRALSGVFENRVLFYHSQVHDATEPVAKRFGVKYLPAVVGILANGQELLLTGENNSGGMKIDELKDLIQKLEVKNQKVFSEKPDQHRSADLQFLTKENFARVCGVDTSFCVIAAAKSGKKLEKAKKLLEKVSQKKLVRTGSISYALLDANKQKAFLQAIGESNLRSEPVFIVYKPRKKKFAVLENPTSQDDLESFVTAASIGDLSFKEAKKQPSFSQ